MSGGMTLDLRVDPAGPPVPGTVRMAGIDEFTAADYNPRTIDRTAAGKLQGSLRTFGMVSIPVVNRRTGRIVGGHQRWTAARESGAVQVPVVEIDVTEAQEKALNITLNNPTIGGVFDVDLLDELLRELADDGFDGFADVGLDGLMSTQDLDELMGDLDRMTESRGAGGGPDMGADDARTLQAADRQARETIAVLSVQFPRSQYEGVMTLIRAHRARTGAEMGAAVAALIEAGAAALGGGEKR